ncbi:MAG: hypothetical protein ABFQ53_01270 [Patescibacteria group bacterium]
MKKTVLIICTLFLVIMSTTLSIAQEKYNQIEIISEYFEKTQDSETIYLGIFVMYEYPKVINEKFLYYEDFLLKLEQSGWKKSTLTNRYLSDYEIRFLFKNNGSATIGIAKSTFLDNIQNLKTTVSNSITTENPETMLTKLNELMTNQ